MKEPRKDSTSSLLEVLRSAHPEDIGEYHRRYLQGKVPTFAGWVDEILESKGMTRQEIFLVPLLLLLPLVFPVPIDGILFAGPIADGAAFLTSVLLVRHEMARIRQQELAQTQ